MLTKKMKTLKRDEVWTYKYLRVENTDEIINVCRFNNMKLDYLNKIEKKNLRRNYKIGKHYVREGE